MGMLQTSLRTADGARCCNVPVTTILCLKHRLQETGPTWTIHVMCYPQESRRQRIDIFAWNAYGISGDHPQKLLQKKQDVKTSEYPHRPCVTISGDLHCMPDDHIEAPSWIGSDVLQGSTRLRYNACPFSICPTQNFPRSKAVHMPWPVYSPSDTPLNIGEGPHWLPNEVTWPTSRNHGTVMPVLREVWAGIPQARITRLSIETHGLSQPLLILLHLAAYCKAKCHNKIVADFTHTKQYLWAVSTIIKFSVEIDVRFFFSQYILQRCTAINEPQSEFIGHAVHFLQYVICLIITTNLDLSRLVGGHLASHLGRVTHICVSNLAIIVLDNGLLPGRHQAIISPNAGILLLWPLGRNFSGIFMRNCNIGIQENALKSFVCETVAILFQPQLCLNKMDAMIQVAC